MWRAWTFEDFIQLYDILIQKMRKTKILPKRSKLLWSAKKGQKISTILLCNHWEPLELCVYPRWANDNFRTWRSSWYWILINFQSRLHAKNGKESWLREKQIHLFFRNFGFRAIYLIPDLSTLLFHWIVNWLKEILGLLQHWLPHQPSLMVT